MSWKSSLLSIAYVVMFLISASDFMSAQNISISSPLRLTNKTGRFKIIGKNQEGILVRVYGKDIEQINVYDENLNFQSSKSIVIKHNEFNPIGYFLKPSGTVFFYTVSSKKHVYVCSVVINDKFETGPELILDTIPFEYALDNFRINLTLSPNQSKCLLYYPIKYPNQALAYRFLCINNRYELLYMKEVPINLSSSSNQIQKSLLTNEGNAIIIQRLIVNDSNIFNFRSIGKDETVNENNFSITTPLHVFDEPIFEWDEKYKLLRISGMKSPDINKDGANGLFQISMGIDSSVSFYTYSFTDSFLQELTGKKKRTDDLLYTFKPKHLISRMDGGSVLILESFYRQDEEYTIPSFNPGMANYRTVNVYHYNDIIVFSLSPDGNIDWYQIIRKSQQSENDNGAYGSFCCLNTNTKLHCFFSSEISSKSFIKDASIAADGSIYTNNLLNQLDSGLLIVPKLGVQISSREILIPSFRENDLKIIKIEY